LNIGELDQKDLDEQDRDQGCVKMILVGRYDHRIHYGEGTMMKRIRIISYSGNYSNPHI
jgi:hypothetical protein